MLNKQQVGNEITSLFGLKELTKTYEEIAALRMSRIRSSVLKSRNFLQDLAVIFIEVASAYKQNLEKTGSGKVKDPRKLSVVKRNGKTVCVYLSANSGLYGDIVRRTFTLFLEYIKKERADMIVIGRIGKQLLDEEGITQNVTYFDFPDHTVDATGIEKLASVLLPYEKILVFYGQFENVVSQSPSMINIGSGDIYKDQQQAVGIKYLFEPSIEQILEYFEKEIFASLLEQTIQESQLAKFASRMISLDVASDRITALMQDASAQQRKLRHWVGNKKQLDAYSGMRLWKRR